MIKKFIDLMGRRNGMDQLNLFIIFFLSASCVLAVFEGILFVGISIFAFILLVFRVFSKDIYKRKKENQIYLRYKEKVDVMVRKYVVGPIEHIIAGQRAKKKYHIFNCPKCKQKIRVPSGKGKIRINCPACKHEFTKIS